MCYAQSGVSRESALEVYELYGSNEDVGAYSKLHIAGVQAIEEQALPAAGKSQLLPSVIHGVLRMPAAVGGERFAVSASLLDASGRKVLALHPGANDVSRVAPGIYFVSEQRAVGSKQSSIRKVVLTR
jgi:hypothetical protein